MGRRKTVFLTSCTVEGCNEDICARGLCRKHYVARMRLEHADKVCIVEGCGCKVKARGLCFKHYKEATIKKRCNVASCNDLVHARGMCYRHYQQQLDRYQMAATR